MNHGTIAGHLGADPEVRFTPSNKKVTTLRVAARGRKKDETVWWKVTIWGDQFDKMIAYLKKGSPVVVFGDIHKPEIYTNREGNPQVSLEMTAQSLSFSPFGKPDQSGGQQQSASQQPMQQDEDPFASVGQNESNMNFSEDDVPF